MKLILGGINGNYLREIVENAGEQTERVDAAVAYATDSTLLFDWCLSKRIPLRFWGRFDDGVPVSIPILRKFLQEGSPIFECRLLRHLHAKVIWWRGYGVYIGSANLSGKAWYNNVEAGTFFLESEITGTEYAPQVESLFKIANQHSTPLTRELVDSIERRQRALEQVERADAASAKSILSNPHVPNWSGLTITTDRKVLSLAKEEFLKEWNSTLEIMRQLARRLSLDENRPPWISASTPSGTQADQFLHAHYYQRTFDGPRAIYETQYESNRSRPDVATTEAIAWWRSQNEAPGTEDVMLNDWAVFLRDHLSESMLQSMTEQDLLGICSRVHAIRDHALRAPNRDLSLSGERSYTREEKLEALSQFLFNARTPSGKSVSQLLQYILYGGTKAELPERLWKATSDADLRIDHLGISALGEIIGWALPDDFPPRNGRSSKALRSLGYDVTVHV